METMSYHFFVNKRESNMFRDEADGEMLLILYLFVC